MGGISPPIGDSRKCQRTWDRGLIEVDKCRLLSSVTSDYDRARLLSVFSPHAGDWINAAPISAVGLRLSNEVIRVAAGLRIGSNLCAPHTCGCGEQVDARGSHGLSCARSAGRSLRHLLVNDIIQRQLIRAGVAAIREPTGLVTGTALRPDGATLIPWARGKCLAWDATIVDTVAPSHLPSTKTQEGAAALRAAEIKTLKYRSLAPTYQIMPISLETFGAWHTESLDFMRELGPRTSLVTGDQRKTTFLL